jgi:hypothetical protein
VYESVFESCGTSGSLEGCQSVASEEAPSVNNGDAIGEKFDLG